MSKKLCLASNGCEGHGHPDIAVRGKSCDGLAQILEVCKDPNTDPGQCEPREFLHHYTPESYSCAEQQDREVTGCTPSKVDVPVADKCRD